jgi:hypothetical protein
MSRTLPILAILVCLAPSPAWPQIVMRPTPPPQVTADASHWYLSRQPILFDGIPYYPTGPVLHFSAQEMVRSGWLDGVPIYTRTTSEPRSVIYVPIAGGLVRPYERRRDGDLAGTVGSSAPSFPVVLAAAGRIDPDPRRAPAPPTGWRVSLLGTVPDVPVGAAGTAGTVQPMAPPDAPVLRTARPPEGINAIFIDHDGVRWRAGGPVVPFDPGRFTASGSYAGFTVYAESGRPDVIYVPVVEGPPGLLTPYRPLAR